jgi:O-antigen/teichoic acid export membrane protein
MWALKTRSRAFSCRATLTRMIRGFLSLLLGTFLVRGLSFGATVVLTRVVGPGDFGTFALGLTVAQVFAVCANFGLDDLLVREIARSPDRASSLLGDQVLLRLATLPLALLGALILGQDHAALYAWFALYAVLHACLLVVCAAFRGLGRPRDHALLLSLQMAFIAPASIAASWLAHSIDLAAAGFAVGTLAALGIGGWLLLRAGLRPSYAWRPRVWTGLLRTGLPFGMVLLGVLLHDRLVFVSVARMQDAQAAGWFGAAYNLVLALSSIAMAASAAAYPVLALEYHRQRPEFVRVARTLLKYTLVVGLAIAAVLRLAAPLLVPVLYGTSYEPSVRVLEIAIWALPTFSVSLVLINVLEGADQQQACAIGIGQALLVSAPVCWLSIGAWGLEGAAVGYVVAHAVLASSLAWRTWPVLAGARFSAAFIRTVDA